MSSAVLDARVTEVNKKRCLPSVSSHNLVGGQERYSQFTVTTTVKGWGGGGDRNKFPEGKRSEWACSNSILHLSCFVLPCGGNVTGGSCLLQKAHPHPVFQLLIHEADWVCLIAPHDRLQEIRLGRSTWDVRHRSWVPAQHSRKPLHLWVFGT